MELKATRYGRLRLLVTAWFCTVTSTTCGNWGRIADTRGGAVQSVFYRFGTGNSVTSITRYPIRQRDVRTKARISY